MNLVRGFLERQGVSFAGHMVPGSTPFLIACQTGQAEVVSLLLGDARIDVNKSDEHETTPIWAAAAGGHLLVVQMILASGRKIEIGRREKDSGKTAAERARANGARTKKAGGESEEEFRRIKENCPKIAELIEGFEADQVTTRKQLRWKLDLEGTVDFFSLLFSLLSSSSNLPALSFSLLPSIIVTWLEEHLDTQLPTIVSYSPIESQEPNEVHSLSMVDCSLTTLSHRLGNSCFQFLALLVSCFLQFLSFF